MRAHRGLALVVIVLSTVGCRNTEVLGPPITPAATAAGAGGAPAAQAGAVAAGAAAGGGATATAGAMAIGAAGGGSPATTASNTDYGKPENWLCRPGHNGPCETEIDSTIVRADGTLEVEKFQANAAAPIDCFYVYPTISTDTTDNSDLVPGPEEEGVVRAQFARFGSQCRLFAPMYRQITLTALRASIAGTLTTMPDRALGYQDVLKAWNYYLEHDNQGRGVVFVGHSQGSGVLTQLIKENLDKSPVDKRFIAALLIGTNVTVPKDTFAGGTFTNIPICKTADELGCIIVYASFRANMPPSAMTNFARSTDPNLVAACTNPAAVGGGSAELHSYLTAAGMVASSAPTPPWVTPEQSINTRFVSTPGLITAECKFGMTGSYLAITVNGHPEDPRVDDIVGDVVTNGMVQADWGLHLVDMHLAMGNLIDVVHAKSAAFGTK